MIGTLLPELVISESTFVGINSESKPKGAESDRGAFTDVDDTLRSEIIRIIEIIALLMFLPRIFDEMIETLCTIFIVSEFCRQLLDHKACFSTFSRCA